MEMEYALPGAFADIGDESPTILEFLIVGNLGGQLEQFGQHLSVPALDLSSGVGHMLLGDQQDVGGCRRVDIPECQNPIGFCYPLRRDRTRRDFAE